MPNYIDKKSLRKSNITLFWNFRYQSTESEANPPKSVPFVHFKWMKWSFYCCLHSVWISNVHPILRTSPVRYFWSNLDYFRLVFRPLYFFCQNVLIKTLKWVCHINGRSWCPRGTKGQISQDIFFNIEAFLFVA